MKTFDLFNSVKKQRLSDTKKSELKNRIFNVIEAEEKVSSYVFADAKKLKLSFSRRAILRERILDKIDKAGFVFDFVFLKNFSKRFFALSLSFLLVFGIFSDYAGEDMVVFAEEFTKIESVSGDVFVYRGEYKLRAFEGMEIKKKDTIFTNNDSEAIISYLDDSVSRLKSDTEFKINELSVFDKSGLKTYVEVEVVSGMVWTKVLNLVEESSSFVVKADDVYAKAKKAAFNIEVAGDKTEVSVYKNTIEIHTPFAGEKIASVMTGQKVVVSKENKVLEVKKIKKEKKSEDWIVKNLNEDDNYVVKIEEKNTEEKQVAVNKEVIVFADVENEKVIFEKAEKEFVEAQLKLQEDSLSEEDKALYLERIASFSDSYKEYSDFISKVSDRDEKYANLLKNSLEEKMIKHKKSLNLVLPDSAIYSAKEEFKEIGYLDLDEEVPIAMKKLDDVKEEFVEAEEMANKGEIDLANKIVEESAEVVEEAKNLIGELDSNDPVAMQINESEIMLNNLQKNVIPDATEIHALIKEGKYGSTVMGDKTMGPLFDLSE